MAKPYSADLRERVLLADAAGLPPAAVAQRFGVGLSTVYLWRQQARTEDRRCAKPHGGGSRRDKQPDPNSPFAKLAALKQQLEQDGKEGS